MANNFFTIDGSNKTYLYQWDINVYISVVDETVSYIRFAHETGEAMQVNIGEISRRAKIPNQLLKKAETITVYGIFVDDEDNEVRISTLGRIPVREANKPSEYIDNPDAVLSLQEVLNDVEAYRAEVATMHTDVKADRNAVELIVNGDGTTTNPGAVALINRAKSDALSAVSAQESSSVTAVGNSKDSALNAISNDKSDALSAISTSKTGALSTLESALTDHKTTLDSYEKLKEGELDAFKTEKERELSAIRDETRGYRDASASSASNAKTSETNAASSESNARSSEANAASSESKAKASETASKENAEIAKQKAEEIKASADAITQNANDLATHKVALMPHSYGGVSYGLSFDAEGNVIFNYKENV